jgi:hypothetical protein
MTVIVLKASRSSGGDYYIALEASVHDRVESSTHRAPEFD